MKPSMLLKLAGSNRGTAMQSAKFGFLPNVKSFYLDSITIEGAGEYVYKLNGKNVRVTLEEDYDGSIYVPNADAGSLLVVRGEAITEISQGEQQTLTSLDVSGLSALTNLNCSYNQFTSLDVSGLSALTYLNCSYNQLTSLDVSGLSALTHLHCNYNQLSMADVTNCHKLQDYEPAASALPGRFDDALESGSTIKVSAAGTYANTIKTGMEAKGWTVQLV